LKVSVDDYVYYYGLRMRVMAIIHISYTLFHEFCAILLPRLVLSFSALCVASSLKKLHRVDHWEKLPQFRFPCFATASKYQTFSVSVSRNGKSCIMPKLLECSYPHGHKWSLQSATQRKKSTALPRDVAIASKRPKTLMQTLREAFSCFIAVSQKCSGIRKACPNETPPT